MPHLTAPRPEQLGPENAGLVRTAPPTVRSAAVAALLLDPKQRMFLLPFFGQGATVSEAALQLGYAGNRVLKQVYKLKKLGLLRVAATIKRKGRPIKRYRVTSETYFVPFAATDAVTVEDLLIQAVDEPNRVVAQALSRMAQAQHKQIGYLIRLLPEGRIAHELSLDGVQIMDSTAFEQVWFRDGQVLNLSSERAHEFLRRQQALLAEFSQECGEPYLVFVAVAPIDPIGYPCEDG